MTHEDEGHYANKHPKDRKVDEKTADTVREKASGGRIPCAAAFKVVHDMGASPAEVGFTIDSLEIKLTHCQLGTFGYGTGKKPIEPLDTVPDETRTAIEGSLENGRLPCRSAWKIAERLGISKLAVGSACETLNIKIGPCQLGAF